MVKGPRRMKLSKFKLVLKVMIAIFLFNAFMNGSKGYAVTSSRYEHLELFSKILHMVESQYYRSVDSEKLLQGAIKGMMNTLDPHSSFLDKEVFSKMQEETNGEFGGVGIEVTQKDGTVIIITPIEDTPAYKAGILPGDKIVEINHESIIGLPLEESVDKMKGDFGSELILGIVREGVDGITEFAIKREMIKIRPVKYELIDNSYALIRLTQFQKKSGALVESALIKLKKQAKKKKSIIKGIILDLRSNPGGLLNEAVNVASVFLKSGIIVSTEGREEGSKEIRYVKKSGVKDLTTPLAVLINGASASASEIVAGALQDLKRGLIMGKQSFGKGSVQSVTKIDDDKGLKLTVAQYMTPKGRKIQAIGIRPDIEIEQLKSGWIDEYKISNSYIRERDLKNHLVATIETEEERLERLRLEKSERQKRILKLKAEKLKKRAKEKSKEIFMKYKSSEDYQVVQAVNYLKAIYSLNK